MSIKTKQSNLILKSHILAINQSLTALGHNIHDGSKCPVCVYHGINQKPKVISYETTYKND